ncbi:MAG TPA: OmpA family protein [Lacipirellulaceae bacterium]|nr:OmpA family protein [Lacipirellulaceae bacterium]
MSFAFLRPTIRATVLAVCGLALMGCSQYSMGPYAQQQPAPVTLSPQQQTALAQQTQQYQQRAASLDRDNQELQSMLAQSRQQSQVLQQQIQATQTQLRDTTDHLASLQSENDQLRGRTSALAASIQTRSQAEIHANNTLLASMTITKMPGINVRQDGDVIRIELPSDQLFNLGTAQLKLGSDAILKTIAADVTQNYPRQLIGIEGHTDNSPMTSPQFPTEQHLAVAQAMAVYDTLTRAEGMPAQQLFVVGHGSSHPIVSNGTEAGRARNRRIEVVIYPETMRR